MTLARRLQRLERLEAGVPPRERGPWDTAYGHVDVLRDQALSIFRAMITGQDVPEQHLSEEEERVCVAWLEEWKRQEVDTRSTVVELAMHELTDEELDLLDQALRPPRYDVSRIRRQHSTRQPTME